MDSEIKELTESFAAGAIGQKDFAKLREYALENKGNREEIRKHLSRYVAAGMLEDEQPVSAASMPFFKTPHGRETSHVNKRKRIIFMLAAAVIVLLLIPTIYMRVRPVAPAFQEWTASAGQSLKVALSDGTTFVLSPGSKMRCPSDYGQPNRNVVLDGEAIVSVVHDANHPFQVTTPNTVVKDVGTIFRVRDFSTMSQGMISLIEGKVQVKFKGKNYSLRPNEQATFATGSRVLNVSEMKSDTSEVKDVHSLIFDNEKLEDVAKLLTKAYGVEVVVDNDKKSNRIFGLFNAQQDSLAAILESISIMDNMKVIKTKEGYKIR